MLTEKAIFDFFELQRIGLKYRVSGVFWNTRYGKSRRKKILYLIILYGGLIYYTCDVLYLTRTFCRLIRDWQTELDTLVGFGVHWLSRLITLLFHYHIIWHRKQLEAYSAQVLHFHRQMKRAFPNLIQQKDTPWHDPNKFMHVLVLGVKYYGFLPSISVWSDSMGPQYWAAHTLPSYIYSSVPYKVALMGTQWYMTSAGAFAAAFFVALIILHINTLKCWLNTFCIRITQMKTRRQAFLAQKELLLAYRELECLRLYFDEAFQTGIPIAILLLLIMHSDLVYSLIRSRGIPPHFMLGLFFCSLICFAFAHVCFNNGGHVSIYSEKLKSYLRLTHSKLLKRQVNACPTINIGIGPYAKLGRDSVINYYYYLINCVVNLLLYTK